MNRFLTPPMGWNSWYCFSEGVSDERIRGAAKGMSERGLAAHGWKYINIDDCWQGERGGEYGAIQGNERFPDMKALGDYIHALDLKFGIYSTPWICSYAGFIGGTTDAGREIPLRMPESERRQKYQVYGTYPEGRNRGVYRIGSEWRFDADVRQWSDWEVDFVKVDWNPNDIPTVKRIANDLNLAQREITLSLSNTTPYENMTEISKYARMWRIGGDIHDTWESIARIGFEIAPRWMAFAGPGRWNDLDMLQVGDIGTPGTLNASYRKSRLTFEEQKTQFVLWSMYSAPLLLSCDLAGMDEVTYRLLTNDGVIAIDQDPLCTQPEITPAGDRLLRYSKRLVDGGEAIAYFNLSDESRQVVTAGENPGIDLFTGEKTALERFELPPHGCVVVTQL